MTSFFSFFRRESESESERVETRDERCERGRIRAEKSFGEKGRRFRSVSVLRQRVHCSYLGCSATGAVHGGTTGVPGGLSILAPFSVGGGTQVPWIIPPRGFLSLSLYLSCFHVLFFARFRGILDISSILKIKIVKIVNIMSIVSVVIMDIEDARGSHRISS